jgi:hypothetical protein
VIEEQVELEAKLKLVLEERDATFALMLKRAESAEAKLAKAVEGLESIVDDCNPRFLVPHSGIRDAAQRTLAELKGESE